jgi:hypothetical protein
MTGAEFFSMHYSYPRLITSGSSSMQKSLSFQALTVSELQSLSQQHAKSQPAGVKSQVQELKSSLCYSKKLTGVISVNLVGHCVYRCCQLGTDKVLRVVTFGANREREERYCFHLNLN